MPTSSSPKPPKKKTPLVPNVPMNSNPFKPATKLPGLKNPVTRRPKRPGGVGGTQNKVR